MKSRLKIYIFGNPALVKDAMPLKLLPKLRERFKEVTFEELDPTENMPEEKHLIILDTIINTGKVRVLNGTGQVISSPNYSLHDFDLGLTLKLMKKLGRIKKVTIIGVPPAKHSLSEVEKAISSLLSENGLRS